MTATWMASVPVEVRAVAEPMTVRWMHILPTWCHEVVFGYEGDGPSEGTLATCQAEPEYRRATITFYGEWLTAPADEREWAVRHEFCHVPLGPLYGFVERLMECIPEAASRIVMEQQWEHHVDGVVCDLAHAFVRPDRAGATHA